jgi:hypothetical protein
MLRIISSNLALDLENINSIEFSPAGFGKFQIDFKTGNCVTVYRTDPAFSDLENFLSNDSSEMITVTENENDDIFVQQVRRKYRTTI